MTLPDDEQAPPKGKCGCGAPSRPPDDDGIVPACPYASEINGIEIECGCCDDCAYQCAQDI